MEKHLHLHRSFCLLRTAAGSLPHNRQISRLFLMALCLFTFLSTGSLQAQTTTISTESGTNFTGGNGVSGSSAITFVIENTNTYPIILTGVDVYWQTTNTGTTPTLWYSTTSLGGAPTIAAPAWTNVVTAPAQNVTTNDYYPTFTNLNVIIPSNTEYRFAVESTNGIRYSGTSPLPSPSILSSGGVNMKVYDATAAGGVVGYGGNLPSPTNTPRAFTGRIHFMPALPCTAPPTGGQAVSSVTTVCPNTTFRLSLTGSSFGTGLTYQWQSSPNGTTWTNITGATNSILDVTQTTTTFYRAQLTCNTQTASSASVQVTTTAIPVSGTFTINKNAPASATNFQSFAAAIASFACGGVNGPVVFNVVAGSGPYNEQVVLPVIPGTSATNTVTFNGNGNTITAAPTGTYSGIVALDGADFVTFNNFVITPTAAATTGWGFQLMNQADNNTISNNTINLPLTSTSTNFNGIVGGATVSTAANNMNNTTIQNNTINGGYYAIRINGATGGNNTIDNKIIGNQIVDNYIYNIYLSNTVGTVIENNNISRPTRSSVSSYYGVFATGENRSMVITRNRFHNAFGGVTNSTGAAYVIYHSSTDAPAGQENLVTNNLIYNINTNGLIYALYNIGSDGVYYYHNTIDLSNTANTGTVRGFFQTTAATNIKFRNNNITINQGATGAKHVMYFATTTSTIESDRNNLYLTGGATGSGIGFFSTNQVTLANWKAVNSSAYDQNSVSVDPIYVNPATGNFTPTNVLIDNHGTPVTPAVTVDINSAPRSTTTPDPGAVEFTVPPIDLGATALAAPAVKPCFGNAEQVTVTIRNWGSSPLNFTTNNATVTVNVTGAVTQTLTTTISNNTLNGGNPLAVGATIDVPVGTLNMSTLGTYTFNASATTAADGNASNNAMPAATRTTTALAAGTAAASQASLCLSGTTTLNLTGNAGGDVQWQQASSATGPFTNIAGATSASYTLAAPITQTTYYRAVVSCGTNSANTNVVTVTVNNPQVTASTGASRCGAGPVTLTATPSAGATINWYTTATGGTPVSTGNSYSPNVSASTTFYAAAAAGGGGTANLGPTTNTIGTGLQSTAPQWLVFDVFANTTLIGVHVYPGAAGNVVLELRNSAGTTITTTTVAVTAADVNQKTFIPLNWALVPGTGFRLGIGTGTVNLFRNDSGASYPYTLPGVLSITGNSFDPTYYYWGYDWLLSTGCESARVPVAVTVNPAPAVNLGGNVSICGATPLVLNAGNAGSTFQWTRNGTVIAGATSQTLSVTTAGTYVVTVTNANNCTATDTAIVTINTPPATPTLTPAGSTAICQGETVTLTAATSTAGVTYRWTRDGNTITGATAATFTANAAGVYRVVVTANGCSDSSATTTVTVNPIPITPSIALSGGTLTSTASSGTYQWYSVSGTTLTPIPGATSRTFTPTQSGTYTVRVNVNGCFSAAPTAITVTVTGISNLAPGMKLDLFPNPTAGKFTVAAEGFEQEVSYTITNVTGQVVHKGSMGGNAKAEVNLSSLSNGIYMIRFESADKVQYRKLVLEK